MKEKRMKLNRKDHKLLTLWAAECAERVLPNFEDKYPKDDRPRQAIAAARAWVRGELTIGAVRSAAFAAHSAARDADEPGAQAAARAAGHAAATAHVATHAPHAATYALTSIMQATGSIAATKEREWQVQNLSEHGLTIVLPSRRNSIK